MRFYVSSQSYPEIRELDATLLGRSIIWARAFLSAARDPAFVLFTLLILGLLATAVLVGLLARTDLLGVRFAGRWPAPAAFALVGMAATLMVSLGGDLIRPHLRRVNESARLACPSCGHSLADRADPRAGGPGDESVGCPECGAIVPRAIFASPYRIPREFRAFRRR